MLLYFENLPLHLFGGKVPFVSMVVGDTTDGADPDDGINLGEAIERVAYSPFVEYDTTEFETVGITDICGAMILTEDMSFIDLLRLLTRFFRSIDIIQFDKLRLKDRGASVTPDITINRDHVTFSQPLAYTRQEESGTARVLVANAIDPDADYVFMPSYGVIPNVPAVLTSATGEEIVTLPLVLTATQRAALVTYAKWHEEAARKRVTFTGMLRTFGAQPGDLIGLSNMANGFDTIEVVKVIETTQGADLTNEIVGEVVIKCNIPGEEGPDPFFSLVVLLCGFEEDNDVEGFEDFSVLDQSVIDSAGADRSFVTAAAEDASCFFTGLASLVHWVGDSSTDFGTGIFTIEGFFRPTAFSGTQFLIARDAGISGGFGWRLYTSTTGGGVTTLHFAMSTDGTDLNVDLSGPSPTLDTWQHIAVDFDGTTYRLYVNGITVDESTTLRDIFVLSFANASLGGNAGGSGGLYIGYMDEIRITNGAARYADPAGFSVPAIPFPRDGT
jgi:hypothetical protein